LNFLQTLNIKSFLLKNSSINKKHSAQRSYIKQVLNVTGATAITIEKI